jgi:hypothetical protein
VLVRAGRPLPLSLSLPSPLSLTPILALIRFELADLWTESMEAHAYADFLTDLQQVIARPKH